MQKHLVLQILVNLIRNAQQACEAADSLVKRITVRLTGDTARHRVRILVEDTGVGIPPENLAQLFTHGFTMREEGHGFGLHSGARMAREMGGALTAHNDGAGKGARFTLELPCPPILPKRQATPGKPSSPPTTSPPSPEPTDR